MISANLIGVLITGLDAANVTVIRNLIGTDRTGEADLGNAEAGIAIDSATGATIEGNGQGSQIISGNLVGVAINGSPHRPEIWLRKLHRNRQSEEPLTESNSSGDGVLIRGGVWQHSGGDDRGGSQRDLSANVLRNRPG